ncbi:MAG: acyl-CoA dehydrogenase [Micromonosporaceae bacterium]|nr:acyl-CoA dehydrogenase [Micromonosporaceae bacterium]
MTVVLDAAQEEFRTQVCALLCEESAREAVAECRRLPAGEEPGLMDLHRRLGERGWLAPNWSRRHGGIDATAVEKAIVSEELIRHGVPDNVHTLGVDIVGLAVHRHGTEAQKDRLLPPLARGEATASVLFSEPDAGSDLGALQTRAEPDGDGWRLRGRKWYSMKSHIADIALCAARTSDSSAQYHGITLFLVPLQSLGVMMRPMWNLTDERFLDVVLDGIRVSRDDVLGEVDDGWQVINQVLALERTGVDSAARAARLLDAVLRHAAKTGQLEDPAYAQRLLDLDARVRASQLLAWRCVANLRDGVPNQVHSAIAKWHSTEVFKELAALAIEVSGLPGTLDARDEAALADGIFESACRDAPGLTLAAGTSEIMLYVIAGSGLGLLS